MDARIAWRQQEIPDEETCSDRSEAASRLRTSARPKADDQFRIEKILARENPGMIGVQPTDETDVGSTRVRIALAGGSEAEQIEARQNEVDEQFQREKSDEPAQQPGTLFPAELSGRTRRIQL